MKNSKTQKDLIKAWTKIELNSSYGFPPDSVISTVYDENKALIITKEGQKNMELIQEVLKKYQ